MHSQGSMPCKQQSDILTEAVVARAVERAVDWAVAVARAEAA